MQFKLAFVSAALATLALASPTARNEPASSCSTGPVQCCQSVQTTTQAANNAGVLALLAVIGVALGDVTGVIGLTCSGINIAGGGTCSAQAVCCTDNADGGLISVGCVPVTL
ncbi:fungal hydrophobin-domain-containing protein [Rhodocollybia butyracea]|uniref:Hydrophobin n=1 Tax=Rhodocollybia butyracea TaxID=206335 RepID=A0A9P5P6F4_9AGAR|nr:fungal hydrophobin-domain-containing protein [Rhodocollybia butyracea]